LLCQSSKSPVDFWFEVDCSSKTKKISSDELDPDTTKRMNTTSGYFEDDAWMAEAAVNEEHPSPFTPVFWGVNAFILVMLLSVCTWCCYFGGKENLEQWSTRRRETDLEYRRALQERIEQQRAARRDSPQKRTARLKHSFHRCRVTMVCQAVISNIEC
jgi:hypothetical protein